MTVIIFQFLVLICLQLAVIAVINIYCDFTLTSYLVKLSSYFKRRVFTIDFQNFSEPENLSAYDGLEFRLKGDGRRYKIIVRTSSDWDALGYTAGFDTEKGKWQSVGIIYCNSCCLYYLIIPTLVCFVLLSFVDSSAIFFLEACISSKNCV